MGSVEGPLERPRQDAQEPGAPADELSQQEARDAFTLEGARFVFERNEPGAISGFSIEAGRVRDIRFVRR